MRGDKFHGRFEQAGQDCQAPDCSEAGEFRAPGSRGSGFDGPGDYFWFCFDHILQFNEGYDWFEGMDDDEIWAAQSPVTGWPLGEGWQSENRVFSGVAGIDGTPRWSDFTDPLDAISGRAAAIKARAAGHQNVHPRFTPREQEALNILGLGADTDRASLRRRYSELVRQYHPDRNEGDRSQEARLGRAVEAYQLLRKCSAFS